MMETDEYPDYVQGPAYLMSTELARVRAVWSNRIGLGNYSASSDDFVVSK